MLYAIYKINDVMDGGVYDMGLKEFERIADNEHAEVLFAYDFKARGKTYSERKDYVESMAIDWSNVEKPNMAWSECWFVDNGFSRLGKRYGLLTDFHENAIC